jgi:iron complex transport system permease protein
VRRPLIVILLTAVLVLAVVIAFRVGAAESSAVILREIRAPRIVMALMIGAGLGLAGTVMQAITHNPLADPAIVGISGGAALGAAAVIFLGVGFGSPVVAAAAVLVALLVAWAINLISRTEGRSEVVTLVLAGVAITAFAAAAVSVLVSTNTSPAIRSISFWTSGSLALSTWSGITSVAPFVLVGVVIVALISGSLDPLSLGDRGAQAAGVDVTRTRVGGLAAVVLLVAAGVSVVGMIAFIGLVIPHAVRAVLGPQHRLLLLASAISGALVLLLADTAARVAVQPVEIPVGAITAIVGAPIFLVLLLRTRAQQGGWA